jgi:hypothetical protein
MWFVIFLPFILQFIVISLDEGIFHLKRGLPRWERIGHPIDTASVLSCVLYVLLIPYSPAALKGFIALAIVSCLLVTKDEFVHKHHCPASEQWLHALLFINHPIVLTSAAMMWPFLHPGETPEWLNWIGHAEQLRLFLLTQLGLISAFMAYQIIYWNFIWKESKQ